MKYFLIIISILLLLSCDSSTSSDDAFTISGSVSLLDSEGNPISDNLDEILVMIYNTVEIDADLLQVKADYSFIGTEINQETFFDIRDEEPLKVINCDALGQYSFSIAKGDYNICYYKEEYGYSLIHELEISSDRDLADVALQEVTSLAGSISNFTFESGRVYHITDDLIIPENSNVLFETGAYVDVADNKKIFLMDNLNTSVVRNNSFVNFNSVFNYLDNKKIFRGIECANFPSFNISKIMVKNASSALTFNSINANINISDSSIINNSLGISTIQADSLYVYNCSIINNSSIGLNLNVNNLCTKNIVFSNNEGIRNVHAKSTLSSNYLLNNYIAVRLGFYESMIINYNEFNKNEYGVSMSGADPVIENNIFLSDAVNIEIGKRYVEGYHEYSDPIIAKNNFLGDKYLIDVMGIHDFNTAWTPSWGTVGNIVCNDNFWNNNKNKIKDGAFYNFNNYLVIIETEKYVSIQNIGIRP